MTVEPLEQERFKAVVDLHILLRKGDRLLYGLRINTGYYNNTYHFPSGHLENGESVLDGLAREAKEEIDIAFNPKDAKLVHVMHNSSGGGRIAFFFELPTWSGQHTNMEPNKCAELKWFHIDRPPQNMIPYARQALQAYREGILFSQFAW